MKPYIKSDLVSQKGELGTAERIGPSGGGEVPADVLRYSEQTLNDTQKTTARKNIGAGTVNPPDEVKITSATADIEPEDNTIYNCGTLTSLTISNPPATGSYSIVFTSGTTATTTTIPATILGLESFAAEANTLYEINVLDNRAVVGSWAVSV